MRFSDCNLVYWYKRGQEDARDNKYPLFRNTRAFGIHATGEGTEHWTAEEEQLNGTAYLNGYYER